MKTIFKSFMIFVAISMAISLTLVSCGSGSGDLGTDDAVATETTTITGKAIDGYISGATVCLDLDDSGICDISTEPFALTKADGSYSLEIKASHKTHINYKTASVVVYGGIDTDTDTKFDGKLKAQPNGKAQVHVTPVTTVADGIYDNGKSGLTVDEAEHRTATVFGVPKDEVSSDPIATNNTKLYAKALAVQKAVDILVAVDDGAAKSSEKAEKIMLAIASGFKSDTVQSDMADIVANIDRSKLNTKSTNAIELAKELAKITDEKMANTLDRLADAKFCDGYLGQAHQFAKNKGVDKPIEKSEAVGYYQDMVTISGRLYFDIDEDKKLTSSDHAIKEKVLFLNYLENGQYSPNRIPTKTDLNGNFKFHFIPNQTKNYIITIDNYSTRYLKIDNLFDKHNNNAYSIDLKQISKNIDLGDIRFVEDSQYFKYGDKREANLNATIYYGRSLKFDIAKSKPIKDRKIELVCTNCIDKLIQVKNSDENGFVQFKVDRRLTHTYEVRESEYCKNDIVHYPSAGKDRPACLWGNFNAFYTDKDVVFSLFEPQNNNNYSISGKVFYDKNKNGIFDGDDEPLQGCDAGVEITVAGKWQIINNCLSENGDYFASFDVEKESYLYEKYGDFFNIKLTHFDKLDVNIPKTPIVTTKTIGKLTEDVVVNFPLVRKDENNNCPQIPTRAQKASDHTIEKTFSSPCDVPDGWDKMGAIKGVVFEDLDGDGKYSDGDKLLPNREVYFNGGGIGTEYENAVFNETTNENGEYRLNIWESGLYANWKMWIELKTGETQVAPKEGIGIVYYDFEVKAPNYIKTINIGVVSDKKEKPSTDTQTDENTNNNQDGLIANIPSGIPVGEIFDIVIKVNTTQEVDTAGAYLNFDPASLKIESLVAGEVFDFVLQKDFDNQAGKIDFASGVWDNKVPNSGFVLLTIKATKLKENAVKSLSFNTTTPRESAIIREGKTVSTKFKL